MPHELRALKWEDVSLERGVAIMRRSVVELKGQPPRIRHSTKTGASPSCPRWCGPWKPTASASTTSASNSGGSGKTRV